MRLRSLIAVSLIGFSCFLATASVLAQERAQKLGTIELLAPLGEKTSIDPSAGFGTMMAYFEDAGIWLMYVTVGICVLWVLYGGILLMLSGYDNSLRSKGLEHMKWSIIGLCICFFAGFILRTLNSLFYK